MRSIFRFRDRDGKGVEKGEDTTPNLKYFFKLFRRKLSSLLSLNILMLFQVLPIVIGVLAYLYASKTPSQTSAVFAPVYGVSLIDSSATTSLLLALHGVPLGIPTFHNASYWIIGACVVFFVLTIGWQSAGSSYVLRGLVRGDAVFVFSDYFYAIRRNFKQAFLYGLIDTVICLALLVDFLYYQSRVGAFWQDVMFWIITALTLLYLIMRPYIYLMLVTFRMKIRKMFKNALIFSALGIKRNFMAVLGIVLLLAVHVVLIVALLPYGIAIPVIIPVVYLVAAIGFIITYAAYPIIDRYMIAPYVTKTEDENADTEAQSE